MFSLNLSAVRVFAHLFPLEAGFFPEAGAHVFSARLEACQPRNPPVSVLLGARGCRCVLDTPCVVWVLESKLQPS